jgi:hypothetical protein
MEILITVITGSAVVLGNLIVGLFVRSVSSKQDDILNELKRMPFTYTQREDCNARQCEVYRRLERIEDNCREQHSN